MKIKIGKFFWYLKVAAAEGEKAGLVTRSTSYFSECVDELKKVSRPTKAEARQATLVTIVLVVFVALTIALFDLIFSQLMKFVIY